MGDVKFHAWKNNVVEMAFWKLGEGNYGRSSKPNHAINRAKKD